MTAAGSSAQDPAAAAATAQHPAQALPGRTAPVIDSAALLQGGKSVTIRHNGELYRLQATRQGKLILTK